MQCLLSNVKHCTKPNFKVLVRPDPGKSKIISVIFKTLRINENRCYIQKTDFGLEINTELLGPQFCRISYLLFTMTTHSLVN